MRRMILSWGALFVALLLPAIACAQGTARLEGQVFDLNGKPDPDVTVTIKNPDTGQSWQVKTDKDGRYQQLGLLSGVYEIAIKDEKENIDSQVGKIRVITDQVNTLPIKLKDIFGSSAPSAEEVKKREEEENKFKNVKLHFDNGVKAMDDANALQTQLKTASADQKSSLQEKRTADCQTAFTEFQMAEQGVTAKEVKNHAVILARLGAAAECAGKYDDAATAFQKAGELQPSAGYYLAYATNLANVGVSLTDPTAAAAKFNDANAACEKAVSLDAAVGASCWKNLGIVLSNKGRQKEAVAPLQKATQADPKDAQAWYLLGGAYSAMIDTKQQGDKLIAVIPPGTVEAYQKCIDLAPNGPYAAPSKEMLDNLAQLSGGEETTVSSRKKKKQ